MLLVTDLNEKLLRTLAPQVRIANPIELRANERAAIVRLVRQAAVDAQLLLELTRALANIFGSKAGKLVEQLESQNLSVAEIVASATEFTLLTFEEQCFLLDHGPELLSDDQLARLVLNPVALLQLYDSISETLPELWLDAMNSVGNAMLPPSQPSSLAATAHNIDKQLIPTGRLARSTPTYQIGLALLSCAASLATLAACTYLIGKASRVENQLAGAPQVYSAEQGTTWELQSSDYTAADLAKLWPLYDPDDYAQSVRDMEQAGTPVVKKLITKLRQSKLAEKEILSVIHARVQEEEATQATWNALAGRIDTELVSQLKAKGLSQKEIVSYIQLFTENK